MDCELLEHKGWGINSCVLLKSTVTILEVLNDSLVSQTAMLFPVFIFTREACLDTRFSSGYVSNYKFQWRLFGGNFRAGTKTGRKLLAVLRHF